LERGGFSRGLADLTAAPRPATSDMKEFERIAAIAAERYREVRQAMEKAVDRARQMDKKFTQATIDLLKETARWEDLLRLYEEESARSVPPEAPQETPTPITSLVPQQEIEATPAVPEAAIAPEAAPITAAAPEEAAEETFVVHTDRMQAFRRAHANL
jgi:hypothetical protein